MMGELSHQFTLSDKRRSGTVLSGLRVKRVDVARLVQRFKGEGKVRGEEVRQYRIGELAQIVGMTPRTIRYYEEIGLLNSVKRVEGGKRIYTDRDCQRLKFIRRLKHLGLTLAEMQELEDIYRIHRTNRKVLPRLLELLGHHANRIDERIQTLNKLKAEIHAYQERIMEKLKGVESNPKDK